MSFEIRLDPMFDSLEREGTTMLTEPPPTRSLSSKWTDVGFGPTFCSSNYFVPSDSDFDSVDQFGSPVL